MKNVNVKSKVKYVLVCVLIVSLLTGMISGCGGKDYINLSEYELTVGIGDEYEIAAAATGGKTIMWSSSDQSIATINSNGVVKALAAGVVTITATAGSATAECTVTVDAILNKGDRKLVWNDEFDGTQIDDTKWGYQTGVKDSYGSSSGPIFWGNNELQYYTEDAVTISDGTMKITASREAMPEGRTFSSARLLTRDKFSFTYGYIEARLALPAETGMWPAFWLLPQPTDTSNSSNVYDSWAANGEIDIVEARGRVDKVTDHTLHYGNSGQSTYSSAHAYLSESYTEWHVYGLEWTADYIAWFVDDTEVYRVNNSTWWTESVSKNENSNAPFDVDFYIIINLAVGGNYDGGVAPDSDFVSVEMKVDYVRVYQ